MSMVCRAFTFVSLVGFGFSARKFHRVKREATDTADKTENADFCWKDSYGRGVGRIPGSCLSNQDRIGLLCYWKCPKGQYRFGFDCHTSCPPGDWRDDGLYCRKYEYGRGFGYTWFARGSCPRHHKQGCERCLAMWYPKCKPGYHKIGCNICRPPKPDCGAVGLGHRIDLSCAKKIYIGSPQIGQCSNNQERQAGLCYNKCRSGYSGIGPVCWGQPPRGWVNCGMGAAENSRVCGERMTNQFTSVGRLALNVASLGTSAAATSAAKKKDNAGKFAELKKKYEDFKKANPKIAAKLKDAERKKKVISEAKSKLDKAEEVVETVSDALDNDYDEMTAADYIRLAAEIADLMDPTGVAGAIAAYSFPKCSALH